MGGIFMMKLDELIGCLFYYKKSNCINPLIKSIVMDSRQVKEGSLFICIEGYTVNGHDFAIEAVKRGAVAIVSEKHLDIDVPIVFVKDSKRAMAILASVFYKHPTTKLSLIGVTGTNGKTTTTHLIEKILRDNGRNTGMIGTMYMKVGNEVINTKNTTPESLSLQQTFSQMVEKGVDTAIMEVSSHALHLGRVRGCDFKTAVFTNLTQDHLDYHKTMDAYRNAKGLFFSQLGNTYNSKKRKIAILNADDPTSLEYEKMTAAQVVTYGLDAQCDIRATDVTFNAQGTSFVANVFGQMKKVRLKLIGKFSVYNALAAIAACVVEGLPLGQIIASLEKVESVPGRFELVDAGQSFTVIVDYAHTPDSLENVLLTVRELAEGKVYIVVGCGGDRDRSKRPIMANVASRLADFVVVTSDNPRSENPADIVKDMEKGLVDITRSVSIIDRKEAIVRAINMANKKDIIVIAGKGHETYQIVGNETFFFDDRIVAKEVIKELLNK